MDKETVVLNKDEIEEVIVELAEQISAKNRAVPENSLVLLGIRRGGVYVAKRIKEKMEKNSKKSPLFGIIDVTLYRDDVPSLRKKKVGVTDVPFRLDDKVVVLVDDVIFTGRTARSALDAIVDFGRPKLIQLCVLIDRGGREVPICPNFVGRKIEIREGKLRANFEEEGEEDKVVLVI